MIARGDGAIFFTGASASVKGYAKSSPFAMGKFALRGLAQSLARELGPQGVHVAHFVIDGAIRLPGRVEDPDRPDSCSTPRRSPTPTCTPCGSRAAPGPGSSSSGRGRSRSEAQARGFLFPARHEKARLTTNQSDRVRDRGGTRSLPRQYAGGQPRLQANGGVILGAGAEPRSSPCR